MAHRVLLADDEKTALFCLLRERYLYLFVLPGNSRCWGRTVSGRRGFHMLKYQGQGFQTLLIETHVMMDGRLR